ncbi:MAG: PDZ domain-containing protein [Acidobacteria bacterium]|nr:MAG: PDZ domain-containing protein [Acidobacteriota bacterium]
MRWLRITAVVGTLAAAGAGVSASVLTGGQDKEKEKDKQKQTAPKSDRREHVIVAPEIQMFGGGGVRIVVEVQEVDADIARERKLPAVEGALVESVADESPAAKAWIKHGDVITSLEGERVRSVRQLQRLVGDTPAGRTVKVGVLRDGKKVDLSVTPEEAEGPMAFGRLGRDLERDMEGLRAMPREFEFRREGPNVYRFEGPGGRTFRFEGPAEGQGPDVQPLPPPRSARPGFRVEPGPNPGWFFEGAPATGRLGATVQDLTPQLEEYFGVKEGVLVATVNPDSAGARAGLKAGDVITSVNGTAVSSPDALVQAVREPADGAEITLGIVRDKKAQTLKVKLPAASRRGGQVES